jgi:hypothetical protein
MSLYDGPQFKRLTHLIDGPLAHEGALVAKFNNKSFLLKAL